MSIYHENRTRYDQEMQAMFAPNCGKKRPHRHPHPHPHPHNLGDVSYACSPGLGCHLLHQSPGTDASGTRYSNMEACNNACSHSSPHSIPTHLIPHHNTPQHHASVIPHYASVIPHHHVPNHHVPHHLSPQHLSQQPNGWTSQALALQCMGKDATGDCAPTCTGGVSGYCFCGQCNNTLTWDCSAGMPEPSCPPQ